MSEPYLALQVIMMPRDANPIPTVVPGKESSPLYSTIFGGVILSYIDQAGAVGARREVVRAGGAPPMLVTVAINRVEFKQPVLVGDVVRFLVQLERIGRTSITVHVSVEAERNGQVLRVTEAELVYVGVDPNSSERRPVPLLPGKVADDGLP
jgi:acyl-CoA thioesterase YciA